MLGAGRGGLCVIVSSWGLMMGTRGILGHSLPAPPVETENRGQLRRWPWSDRRGAAPQRSWRDPPNVSRCLKWLLAYIWNDSRYSL